MPVLNRSADRFQRALDGERITDEGLVELVETSRHLVALVLDRAGAGRRLRRHPARAADGRGRPDAGTRARSPPRPPPPAAPRRAPPRSSSWSVAGCPACSPAPPRRRSSSAAVVGAVSRSAVPGDALYPVKGWLDGVAVRLADNDLDRGQTYLVAGPGPHLRRPQAGRAAARTPATSTSRSRRDRLGAQGPPGARHLVCRDRQPPGAARHARLHRPHPAADRRAAHRGAGRVAAELGQLEDLLRDTQQSTSRRIAACGSACTAACPRPSDPVRALPGSSADHGRPGSHHRRRLGGGITVPDTA